jgi:hypothetical protein
MLNTHSCYSLRYGVLQPDAVVDWSLTSGYERIALTDINNTSAALSFIRLVQQQGRVPVVGIDFRNGIDCCYVGIARNNEGFMELNGFLSRHLHDGTDLPTVAPDFANCYVIYPWKKAPAILRTHEYVGIEPHQLNRFRLHTPDNPEKYVALAPMSFLSKRHYNTHRLLRAIDCNTLLSKLPPEQQTRKDELFVSREMLKNRYDGFTELIVRAEQLL